MTDVRIIGLEDLPAPLSMLWCQPYVPLQLDLREGVNVRQLRLVLGDKPGNLLVVGLDEASGALTTVSLEGELVLEGDATVVERWRAAALTRGRTLLDVASWAGARTGVLRDTRRVRVILDGACVVIVVAEPFEPVLRHALNLSEVLTDVSGHLVGFAFPEISVEHLERLRANAQVTP